MIEAHYADAPVLLARAIEAQERRVIYQPIYTIAFYLARKFSQLTMKFDYDAATPRWLMADILQDAAADLQHMRFIFWRAGIRPPFQRAAA